jgi:hypothetical protein
MPDIPAMPAPDELVGLRLAIVRRAADMLVLHFGNVVPHPSGKGNVGQVTLHIQGPWRLDGSGKTIVGRNDLWEYGGAGSAPSDWTYEAGTSVQDVRLDQLFGQRTLRYEWKVDDTDYVVISATQTATGDLRIAFANSGMLIVFPDGVSTECWRLFKIGGDHLVFPAEEAGN